MRAGLSTIQQTLTPEAATVLNLSIAEAGRRNHGQTTPLHVAATLLASPSGFLRQACIRSHPNSSHPLQCRALELCFSVALDRLPTAQTTASAAAEPPISNALMAALKRAQAHQRRGCPEQQQQPLLAVKVELSQLIISILDDPSVSRVMREASFSSPAVKATIEQSLNSQVGSANSSMIGMGFRPTPSPVQSANMYMNPRLQQGNSGNPAHSGQHRNDEIRRIIEILLRSKSKNPVLVGESEPETVLRELLRRIEKGEFDEGPLKNIEVISIAKELALDRMQMPEKVKELGRVIEGRIGSSNCGGVVLDLGDLKWLVDQNVSVGVWGSGGVPQQVVSETGRVAVAEMGKLLGRFSGRLWLIGTATCETYLRCQVYFPSMEKDWDLQAVPIASRSPLPAMFPRLGINGILSSSVESLSPFKNFPMATTTLPRRVSENMDPARRMSCCPQCKENYEQELAKLESKELDKSSSEILPDAPQPPLPQWLRNAKVCNSDVNTKDQLQTKDQERQEIQKKWSATCLHLHPNFHSSLRSDISAPAALSTTGLYNPNLLLRQPFQPKLQQTRNVGETPQLNPTPVTAQHLDSAGSPPRSPVRTDLFLGPTKTTETYPEKTHIECAKEIPGCISSVPLANFHLQNEKFATKLDADSFKKLLKGLMERVWWQPEAASAVAATLTQCKLGNRKQRGAGSKGDIWILFTGPDRMGKKKMASVLSEQVCGANPVTICLGSQRDDGKADINFRGKTVVDRIAEAVRRNPFSVIVLEDIDEADMLVRGSIKRAMERGRLVDSHGREISIGNVIFILTANGMPDDLKSSLNENLLDEKKVTSVASGSWQLRLSVGEKSAKRPANWLHSEDRSTKPRKEMGASGLSFDLNQVADIEDDRTDGSHNSSELTIDHEGEHGLDNKRFSITSLPHDLVESLDDAILFKPVYIAPIRAEIENTITKKFHSVVDDKISIQVEKEALEKILGGLWFGQSSLGEWAETVLLPGFRQLNARLPTTSLALSDEAMVVRLELDGGSDSQGNGDWLPSKITVMVDKSTRADTIGV